MQKNSKTLPAIALVILLAFLGLFFGMATGSLFVPKGSGLAGPAIALGYGVIGLAIAVIAGIVLARKFTLAQLRRALLGVFIVSLLAGGWLTYRMRTNIARRSKTPVLQPKPQAPVQESPAAILSTGLIFCSIFCSGNHCPMSTESKGQKNILFFCLYGSGF